MKDNVMKSMNKYKKTRKLSKNSSFKIMDNLMDASVFNTN